ncbi:pentapeptide repeat-containing protein [Shimia sp.]|uniref:pentapeptide repeat-containing protein n=1 Tax=Shimia sp. TaxID=1954381 RepID=UPI0032983B5A
MTTQVERIDALTKNARATWFALLSVLLFVGITLMGVEHIDFYGVNRATDLPLINVSVPTPLFFYAAPLLVTAIYAYFHLYLIRLWDALGAADATQGDQPLGQAIAPWLLLDSALFLRKSRFGQKDQSTPRRAMEWPNAFWNFLLAWAFGPIVLGFLWLESLAARSFVMTGLIAACLLFALIFAWASMVMMIRRMRDGASANPNVWQGLGINISLILTTPFIFIISHSLTEEPSDWIPLAPLDLTGQDLVERPAGWLPYDIARKEFLSQWCKREAPACQRPSAPKPGWLTRTFGHPDQADVTPQPEFIPPEAFESEWKARQSATHAALKKPTWSAAKATRPDLRHAVMPNAFLPGASLSRAQMQNAILSEAQMQNANLSEAQMQNVNLFEAQIQNANLFRSQMQNADLSGAQMQNANLSEAKMKGAILFRSKMHNSNLSWAKMQNAILIETQMQNANLFRSQMQNAIITGAQMQNADLSGALLTGAPEAPILLYATNLNASINNGGALRFVDFNSAILDAKTDWRNAFFDASVAIPPNMQKQIGHPCLRNWVGENPVPLIDEEFFGRWHGWLTLDPSWHKLKWQLIAPPQYHDVPAIPPPPGCTWFTDPIDPDTAN